MGILLESPATCTKVQKMSEWTNGTFLKGRVIPRSFTRGMLDIVRIININTNQLRQTPSQQPPDFTPNDKDSSAHIPLSGSLEDHEAREPQSF